MSTTAASSGFYVLGGTLTRDAPCYVRRQADGDLNSALRDGQFCYVLTSRQMGKSSLMVRTAVSLRKDGAKVAVIDLTALGQNLTPEQWYLGLLGRAGAQLDLEDELEDFWQAHAALGPLQRWMRAIREVVMAHASSPVVIFIDEIDATRSLPFSADEFFAGIRELYNERSEAPELQRLTFCLLGVATPSDLIQDTRTTPFNIGQRIDLTDFSEQEAVILRRGLNRPEEDLGNKLLRRILYWTGGHPYLTQRLCQAVGEDPSVQDASGVDRVCDDIFLSTKARERDDNLLFVRDRMLRSSVDPAALLTLYAQILAGSRVKDEPANPMFTVLRLAGIVRSEGGYLHVRNRIYQRVFGKAFVIANLPVDEMQRQQAAERRGRLKVVKIAVPIVLVFIALLAITLREYFDATNKATEASRMRDLAAGSLSKAENAARRETTAAANEKKAAQEAISANSKAQQALYQAVNSQQRAERATLALQTEKEKTLQRFNRGLDLMLENANHFRDVIPDKPELLSPYLKTIDATDNQIDAVLELDPTNQRALSMKAYDRYFAADAWRRLDKLDKAREAIKQSIELAAGWEKDPAPLLQAMSARTYANAAVAESQMQDVKLTEEYQAKAASVSNAVEGRLRNDNFEILNMLLVTHNVIASLKSDNKDWPGAVQEYQRVIALATKSAGSEKKRELDAWMNIGHIEMKRYRYDAASQSFEKVLAIATTPVDVWDAQESLGEALYSRPQTRSDSVKYFTAAAASGEKAMKVDPSATNRQKLETTFGWLAKTQRVLRRPKEALLAYRRQLELVKESTDQDPSTSNVLALADAYASLANFETRHDKSAAESDYANSRMAWLKTDTNSGVVQLAFSILNWKWGEFEASLQKLEEAKTRYLEAATSGQKAVDLLQQELNWTKDPFQTRENLMHAYETLGWVKLAFNDRQGAVESMRRSLEASRQGVEIARRARAGNANSDSDARTASALGSLAWLEILNDEPSEAIPAAQDGLKLDEGERWITGNLAHAYMFANRPDDARALYLKTRGEAVLEDVFEEAVLADFRQLRRLGLQRPLMSEIEKLFNN